MADLSRILGSMMATGMAGRSRRGPGFVGKAASGGGFKRTAGLAALGYLAYKAYQEYQRNNPGAAGGAGAAGRPAAKGAGGSLGERLADLLRPDQRAEPEAALGDRKALLLIRAMIAAANADGTISAEERQRILSRLQAAGASAEDRRFVESELDAPQPMDAVVRDVRDPDTAEQVFLASAMAIDADSPAERSYLDYLAARLNLDAAQVQRLKEMT